MASLLPALSVVCKVASCNLRRRHTTFGISSGRVISPSQRLLPYNTQHSHETDIHAPSGIRTHNHSKRDSNSQSQQARGRTAGRLLGSAILTFIRHKIKFGTQFYSVTVRLLQKFVRQLCIHFTLLNMKS